MDSSSNSLGNMQEQRARIQRVVDLMAHKPGVQSSSYVMDEDGEDQLLRFLLETTDSVIEESCLLAKHRSQSSEDTVVLQTSDVSFILGK
jgi:hypothetical protein